MAAKAALVIATLALVISVANVALDKTGPRGPRGVPGARGKIGRTGTPGPTGRQGPDGLPAPPPLVIGASTSQVNSIKRAVEELCEQGLIDGYEPGTTVNDLTLNRFYCTNTP